MSDHVQTLLYSEQFSAHFEPHFLHGALMLLESLVNSGGLTLSAPPATVQLEAQA